MQMLKMLKPNQLPNAQLAAAGGKMFTINYNNENYYISEKDMQLFTVELAKKQKVTYQSVDDGIEFFVV